MTKQILSEWAKRVGEKSGRKEWAKRVGEKSGRKEWAKRVGEKRSITVLDHKGRVGEGYEQDIKDSS